jgi:heavy metal efflux system protein
MKTKCIAVLLLLGAKCFAQQNTFSLEEAIQYALKNNPGIQSAAYDVESRRQLKKTALDLPKTDVTVLYGQFNSFENDNNITVSQAIPFTVFGSQSKLQKSMLTSLELKKAYTENELLFRLKELFNQLAYTHSLRGLLLQQDSIFEGFHRAASARYKAGETNLLEQTTAEAQRNRAKIKVRENENELAILRAQLRMLLNTSEIPYITDTILTEKPYPVTVDTATLSHSPSLEYLRQQIEIAKMEKKFQVAKAAPDLVVGYFNQTLIGTDVTSNKRFSGIQIGLSLPLWFVPHQGRIRAAAYEIKSKTTSYANYHNIAIAEFHQAIQNLQTHKATLEYYRSSALLNADRIIKQSQLAFKNGDSSYAEFLLALQNAIEIKEGHLKTLYNYNQSINQLEFLSGNK